MNDKLKDKMYKFFAPICVNKFLFSITAVILFTGGYFYGQYRHSISDSVLENEDGEIHQYQQVHKLINPILGCESAKFNKYTPYESAIKERINKEVIQKNPDIVYSLYFRNLNNGPWFAINEKEEFYPASLLKVPTMMAYLKKAETENGILEKEVFFNGQADQMVHFVSPSQQLKTGERYSVEELIRRMIAYSDNQAAALLVENISKDDLDKTYSDLGLASPLSDSSFSTITTRDMASFFRILYNAAYLTQEKSEWALQLLVESQFQQGLVAGVPKEVLVAHKFGERKIPDEKVNNSQLHDCGIIYHTNLPYVLCVMTKGNDFDRLSQSIAGISKIVYEEVDERY